MPSGSEQHERSLVGLEHLRGRSHDTVAHGPLPLLASQRCDLVGDLLEASVRGAGAGVSFTEGGIRESAGILLDGDPKGVWKLLDGFPGGLRAIELAPPDTRILFSFKAHLRTLDQRAAELAKELPAANTQKVRDAIREICEIADLDCEKDVLPAAGDEMRVMIFQPKAGMIPDWVFGLDYEDEAAFRRLLASVKKAVGFFAKFPEVDLGNERKGFRIEAGLPDAPVGLVEKKRMYIASRKQLLLDAFDKWGAERSKSLAKDSPVFRRTLRGLTGGSKDEIVALAYGDLRHGLPLAMGMLPAVFPRWLEDYVDMDNMPDPAVLFDRLAGVAISLRAGKRGITIDTYSPVGVATIGPLLLFRAVEEWK